MLSRFDAVIGESASDFIVFNYDILLEQYYYSMWKWHPSDGYGMDFRNVDSLATPPNASSIKIHKPHGSITWHSPSVGEVAPDVMLQDNDWNEFFPGALRIPRAFDQPRDGCDFAAFLPTYLKNFQHAYQLDVWRNVGSALRNADEIFVGYSFPAADPAIISLIIGIDMESKTVTVIDPALDHVSEVRLASYFAPAQMVFHRAKLEEFLSG